MLVPPVGTLHLNYSDNAKAAKLSYYPPSISTYGAELTGVEYGEDCSTIV